MTRNSGGAIDRGPAPEPGRDRIGDVAGKEAGKGEDPSPDETLDPDDCTAHDRAS